MTDLRQRKGKLTISLEYLRQYDEDLLRVFFSNFFPLAIQADHMADFYDSVTYLGVSPHFDIVAEGCISPEYSMEISIGEDGKPKFEKFIK